MVICTQKQLNKIVENTLETTYQYLKNCLAENGIDLPRKINDIEKYINELNKLKKLQKDR